MRFIVFFGCALLTFGCAGPNSTSGQAYDIKGKVIAVDHEKKEIKLDHEEIPNLMHAMTMTFKVQDGKLLDDLKKDDRVQGKLKVIDGNYVLISLREIKSVAEEQAVKEEEIRSSLAKLSPEDRQLAEAQRFCPVANKRLGSMDEPVKVDVKGRPVFLCCDGCKARVEKDPDGILAKIDERKKKTQ